MFDKMFGVVFLLTFLFFMWEAVRRGLQEAADSDPFEYIRVECDCGTPYKIDRLTFLQQVAAGLPLRTLQFETFACRGCRTSVWDKLRKDRWVRKCAPKHFPYVMKKALGAPMPPQGRLDNVTLLHLAGTNCHPQCGCCHNKADTKCICVDTGYAPHQYDPACPEHGSH